MFDRDTNKIVIFLYEDVMLYPPVISLVEGLLSNGIRTTLVSQCSGRLPELVEKNELFQKCIVNEMQEKKNIIYRVNRRRYFEKQFTEKLELLIKENDIVWTVNPIVVRMLGKKLLNYSDRHIMELMELTDSLPLFKNAKVLKFDLKKYAKKAWKVVVPEKNRAYIQRVMWDLTATPFVMPNKPYYYDPGIMTQDIKRSIEILKNEKRKIIIYLGIIDPERSLTEFAEAIDSMKDEFAFYAFGKTTSDSMNSYIEDLSKKYSSFHYMGFVNPPGHLHFMEYARLALLPYNLDIIDDSFAKLNNLYCAPNKIYEYAGSSVPMIGTDAISLQEPFEKYGIGMCCERLDKECIINAIRIVDEKHDEFSGNCRKFYDSIDLDLILNKILFD